MAPLKVPDDGLLLLSEQGDNPPFPSQAFAITLDDDILDDLIRSFEHGEEIQLSLGSSPALHYGQSSHTLSQTSDDIEHDFYLTQPFSESVKRARKVPNTMSILSKPKPKILMDKKMNAKAPEKASASATSVTKEKPKKSRGSPGLDSDIEALQNSLAGAEAQKPQTLVFDSIAGRAGGKRGKTLGATLPRGSSIPGSMPSSPALNAVKGSPSLGPSSGSATKQAVERAREQRITLIHELAAQDRTQEFLEKKWTGKKEDFMPTLKKIAECSEATKKWRMTSKTYWKELDVWNYNYETQELRQKAIDNAVRQYDKNRLSTSSPEWDLLLPKEERGKGKCLSRLQATLSKQSAAAAPAAPAPKITVQKIDGSTDSSKDDSDAKATSMSRSSSNPLPARKTDTKRIGVKKSATPSRVSPNKPKTTAKASEKKYLSNEFVRDSDDSDSSENQALAAKAKPAQKPKPSAVPRARESMTPSTTTKATAPAKPVAKPATKPAAPKTLPTKTSTKRSREYDLEDDDSSSSDPPLIKRQKAKATAKAPPAKIGARAPIPALKHRSAESTNQRTSSSSGYSFKSNKNTSPTKSSPLASSPPTNASDLSQEETPEPPAVQTPLKKRTISDRDRDDRDDRDKREAPAKRQKQEERERERNLPRSLIDKAHQFKEYYEQYQELHYSLTSLDHPPKHKVKKLLDLRDMLSKMKAEIYKECPS